MKLINIHHQDNKLIGKSSQFPNASGDEMEDTTLITHLQQAFPTRSNHVSSNLAVPLGHPEIRGGSIVIPNTHQLKKLGSELHMTSDCEEDEDIVTKIMKRGRSAV